MRLSHERFRIPLSILGIVLCLGSMAPGACDESPQCGGDSGSPDSGSPPTAALNDQAYGPHLQQQLDVYLQTVGASPAPVLIYTHGGLSEAAADPDQLSRLPPPPIMAQRARGWAIVAVSFRALPEHTGYDQVRDLKRVVKWVRANTTHANYNGKQLDPDHIVVSGVSGGAYMSAMVAVTNGLSTFEPVDGYATPYQALENKSSKVQGAIVYQGPDFLTIQQNPTEPGVIQGLVRCGANKYLGCKLHGQAAPTAVGCTNCPVDTGLPDCAGVWNTYQASPKNYVSNAGCGSGQANEQCAAPMYLAYSAYDTLSDGGIQSGDSFIGKSSGEGIRNAYRTAGLCDRVSLDLMPNQQHSDVMASLHQQSMECFLNRIRGTACTCSGIDYCNTCP